MRLLVSFLLLIGNSSVLADRPTNVVLFLVDDMGWMDSEPYGSEYYETPNMQKLAEQSMRFTDAYAIPLCSPSRASILSGQYSSRHGVTSASGHQPPAEPDAPRYPKKASPNSEFIYAQSKNYLDPEIVTLAEVLREAGYRTGHFGKWHLGAAQAYWPDQAGFETTWFCTPDPGPPSYFSPYGVQPEGVVGHQNKVGNITDGPEGEYITDRLTDQALKFIEAHKDEPFFLNLWQYGVHGPWGHKEAYTAEFAKKTDPRGEQRNPIMASMLKSVDDSLGRVMAKLDELGLSEDTLFLFYSDNGGNTHSNGAGDSKMEKIQPGHPKYPFVEDWRKWAGQEYPTNNAPLREGKGRIYEGGQRVPLMVRWPGRIQPGSTSDAVVGPIDLYPTVLDALAVSPPKQHVIDGLSILPVLEGTGDLEREALFTWFPHLVPAVSVRAGDYKLISRWEPHARYPETRELYHLGDDIGETRNLAKEMPEKVAELERLMEGFIQDTGALEPIPNPAYRPQVATATASRSADWGLVPKLVRIQLGAASLQVEAEKADRPGFLGTAQIKHAEPVQVELRLRARAGGTGRLTWKTRQQAEFPPEGQSVEFEVEAGTAWQEVEVRLPLESPTQLVRLYLPVENGPVEVASIRYRDENTGQLLKEWRFTPAE